MLIMCLAEDPLGIEGACVYVSHSFIFILNIIPNVK